MKASERLRSGPALLTVAKPPSLTELARAVDRVLKRWPDSVAAPEMATRDALAREMLGRVTRWDWAGVPTQRVAAAAFAAFDKDHCNKAALQPLRAFYVREILSNDQGTFLEAMFRVYLDSFTPAASHTHDLSAALEKRRDWLGWRVQQMLKHLPALLSPGRAAYAVAEFMAAATDPYRALKVAGFTSPHSPGLLTHVHLAFIDRVAPRLDHACEQDRLLRWLKPENGEALQAGASEAVAALLAPWREKSPSEAVQSKLTQAIVGSYGDPRIMRGGIWGGFSEDLKRIFFRWLTKEDMQFFCDVITHTQDDHQWPPRRDFWLRLFQAGRIDEAWVAFGSTARDYAKRLFAGNSSIDVDRRFARQPDRGGSTSLLIMRIGNKIVVDGCHNYKTHIFRTDLADGPKLYQAAYNCDTIMRRSTLSKAHSHIPSWQRWVEQYI